VTSSWGTFLKPAAGRGYLAFGPERGRNVTFVHPGAWLGIEIPEPDEAGIDPLIVRHLHAFPAATKGELARWWGVTAGKLTKPLKRLEDRIDLVDVEGTKAYVLAEDLATLRRTRPEPATTIRLLGGFDPYTLSLQKEAEPLLPMARRPLVSRTAGWMARNRAVALAAVSPGRSRAIMFIHQSVRSSRRLRSRMTSGSAPSGSATSKERPTSGPRKPRGVTPTMVNGTRSTRIVRPTTSGAPA